MRQDPPLGVASILQRKGNLIHLVPVLLQKLPEECQFDSLSLSYPLGDHKAVVLFDQ